MCIPFDVEILLLEIYTKEFMENRISNVFQKITSYLKC